jgi:hypothetical protein
VEHGVARDAGIVNQHLDRTELSFDLFYALGAGLVRRYVPFEYRDAGLGLELLSGLVIAAIVGRNLITGRFQCFRDCRPDPTGSTSDQCNSRHGCFTSELSS